MLSMENGPDTALTKCAEVNPFVYSELGKSLYFAVVTNVFHTTVQDFWFFYVWPKTQLSPAIEYLLTPFMGNGCTLSQREE